MKALITGASSGIGEAMAEILTREGHDVVAVGRNEKQLKRLQENIGCACFALDLSKTENCKILYEKVRDVEILINSAGFGIIGYFTEYELERDIEMIGINICALHILTKLYLSDMQERNFGYVLNVASIAGFLSGPQMAAYYASKSYVVRLTGALASELKSKRSNVYIGALCPGPVKTNFNRRAGVEFSINGKEAGTVAEYAIRNMFRRKQFILPGFQIKLVKFGVRFLPDRVSAYLAGKMQTQKQK